jgi:hypothetical protein
LPSARVPHERVNLIRPHVEPRQDESVSRSSGLKSARSLYEGCSASETSKDWNAINNGITVSLLADETIAFLPERLFVTRRCK